jgi:hypothetical protein
VTPSLRLPRLIALLVAALAAALAAAAVSAQPAGARAQLGIVPAGYAIANPAQFQADIAELSAGKRYVPPIRIDILWPSIAPTQPTNPEDPADPAYVWAPLDAAVQSAAATGTDSILGTVFWTPAWASSRRSVGTRTDVPDAGELAAFFTALQTRYSGLPGAQPRIRNWEVWNEANNRYFLIAPGRNDSAKLTNLVTGYSRMLTQSRAALRATSRRLGIAMPVVVAGGVGGQAGFSHTKFFEALGRTPLCKGAARSRSCFDAVSVHPYSPNPKVDPLGRRVNPQFATISNFAFFADSIRKTWRGRSIKIWVTEFGWQTNPPDGQLGVSPARQAQLMRTAVTTFRKKYPQVPVMMWFLIEDEPDVGNWQSGIEYADGTRKPSWNTFKSLLD